MDDLSQKEIEAFRTRLRQRQNTLRGAIAEEVQHEERENYAEIVGRVRDTGDDAMADLLGDLNIAALDRELNEWRDIEDALERIQNGGFGLCVDCGGEIERGRLDAYPTAKRCLGCQRHYEATFAVQRHTTI